MKRNNRLVIFLLAVISLLLTVFAGNARRERNYAVTPTKSINLTVDSIDYCDDHTRIYGKLIGRPHTSNRIDKVELKSANKSYTSTDIDGIDFARWFQWEDEGVIAVEIDFEPMPTISSAHMYITTPKSIDEVVITNRK